MTAPEPNALEEIVVAGDHLVGRVKQLVHEGNVRRIMIKNGDGHTVFEIPLTVGVIGVALMPMWVALGSIAALASHYTLVVERRAPD
jgi:hypothetical protein